MLLSFGPFELDLRTSELRKYGIRIKLQDKPFQILAMLLEQPGEVVSREKLRQRLWDADTFVDFDQSLNSAIKKLRQALGDSADSPRYVETQARRGYRFLAPVQIIQPTPAEEDAPTPPPEVEPPALPSSPPHRPWALAVTIGALALALVIGIWAARNFRSEAKPRANSVRILSLAVLPLANLSGETSQDYFADGLTDALIGNLARIGALRVISRTSAMQYKRTHKLLPEIAHELHVDGVVEGTVRRSGSRVQINVQLIEAAADHPLWSQTYERDLEDILTLQNEIAATIAKQIRIKLTPQEQQLLSSNAHAIDPAAYEDYLRGRFFWNNRSADGLKKGIQYFRQALDKDPDYALAYAGLADCYNMFSYYGVASPGESFPQARQAALRALELDAELGEAHAALAFGRLHYDWDWAGAEFEFKQAIALNPGYANAHHWYSHYLLATGHTESSLSEVHKALALDPLNLSISTHMGHEYIYAGQYAQAVEQLLKTVELNPNSTRAHVLLAEAYTHESRFGDAQAEFGKAATLSPGDPQVQAALAHSYAIRGESQKSRDLLAKLMPVWHQQKIGAYPIAMIYAGLRETDQAFEWLQKACNERSEGFFYLNVDPDMKSLRSDARFHGLLSRLGLPN